MTVSEATIHSGVQDAIQALSEFASASVIVNDYSVYDDPVSNAPYVLIENSDEFETRQDTSVQTTAWSIKLTLIEAFTDWTTTLNSFRTNRQALIDMVTGNTWAFGTSEGFDTTSLSSAGPIIPFYDSYEDEPAESLPTFIQQEMTLSTEEF